MRISLLVLKQQDFTNERAAAISVTSLKILATVCTVKTNKFYIPGETSIAERLRKKAFDTGTFTLLCHMN